jgi:hypothetical protein
MKRLQKRGYGRMPWEEYKSIVKNDVWDVVPRPKEKSVVSSKWIYKMKHAVDGSIEKYKARFVARGFSRRRALTMRRHFLSCEIYLNRDYTFVGRSNEMEGASHGCEDSLLEW